MIVNTFRQPWPTFEGHRVALGLFDGQADPPESCRGTALEALIARLLASKDAPVEVGEVLTLHGVAGVRAEAVCLFGLGTRADFDTGTAFDAGVALARKVAGKVPRRLAVVLPDGVDAATTAESLTTGLVVGSLGCDLRKKERGRAPFEELSIVAPPEISALDEATQTGLVIGDAVNLARTLVNTPPAEKSPRVLAERSRAAAEAVGIGVDVWDESRLRVERFGGLLGVAAGSAEPPAFVILDYPGGGPDATTLALVGKGVTFDSGGLSLKPTSSMEDMKSDMTGAAVVLAAMVAAARLKLPLNLRGYLPITENMTGGRALKLGDVLTIRDGTTVEVLNSDAEGRLILADALSYAVESKPARLVDLATLTGACMVALGMDTAGLFSDHDTFAEEVQAASERAGERVWRLPLDNDFKEEIKSHVADLKNVGERWGGASIAAKFLEHFVAEVPWVHLDIAGPSWRDSDGPCHDAGGTGCFARTLIALFRDRVASHS